MFQSQTHQHLVTVNIHFLPAEHHAPGSLHYWGFKHWMAHSSELMKTTYCSCPPCFGLKWHCQSYFCLLNKYWTDPTQSILCKNKGHHAFPHWVFVRTCVPLPASRTLLSFYRNNKVRQNVKTFRCLSLFFFPCLKQHKNVEVALWILRCSEWTWSSRTLCSTQRCPSGCWTPWTHASGPLRAAKSWHRQSARVHTNVGVM